MKQFKNQAEAHAYFTECNLATLEVLLMKKSSSKSSISRQRSICINMLSWVDNNHIGTDNPRLVKIMKDVNKMASEQLTPATVDTFYRNIELSIDKHISIYFNLL